MILVGLVDTDMVCMCIMYFIVSRVTFERCRQNL